MSLTDSDRTLWVDPPLAEETDCDVEMGLATGRRNALVQVEPESIDTIPELETVKFFLRFVIWKKKIFISPHFINSIFSFIGDVNQ